MLTLALLALTLSAKPPVVCLRVTGQICDFTFQTLDQAEAEAPADSMFLVAAPGVVMPLKAVINIFRLEAVVRAYLKEHQAKEGAVAATSAATQKPHFLA